MKSRDVELALLAQPLFIGARSLPERVEPHVGDVPFPNILDRREITRIFLDNHLSLQKNVPVARFRLQTVYMPYKCANLTRGIPY